jgi:putative ABC transport system permease protein
MGIKNWLPIRSCFRKRPKAEDFREEVEAHIAMRAEHEGIDQNAASRRFGNVLQTEEKMRRVWICGFWDTLIQDIRYIQRTWAHNPGFAVTVVFVLALGLGASTALFSVLDRILFRSLPYPDADGIVSVGISKPPFSTEFIPERGYTEYWHPAPDPYESIAVILTAGMQCDITE